MKIRTCSSCGGLRYGSMGGVLCIDCSTGGELTSDPPPEMKPYPSEHACRVRDPKAFKSGSFRRVSRGEGRNRLYLIVGRLHGNNSTTLQAFRYPKSDWVVSRARAHCKRHNGIRFEAASSDSMLDTGAADAGYFTQKETTMDELTLDFKELLEAVETRGAFQFHAEIKTINEKDRIIEGYANTKNVDRVGERVEPGAFRRSLAPFKRRGKILRNHDWREPIGKAIDARIDDTGFWIKAKIEEGIDYIDEAWEQITRKLLDSFSIGYRVLKVSRPEEDERSKGDPWRIIELLDLYEVSVVTIPANVQSTFSIAKGMKHGSDLWLQDADLWAATGKDGDLVVMKDKSPWEWVDSNATPDEAEYLSTATPEPYARTAEYVKKVTAEIEEGMKRASAIEALERVNSELKAGGD